MITQLNYDATQQIPAITQGFMKNIEHHAKTGTYIVNINGCEIIVDPYVFPPASEQSLSSKGIYEVLQPQYVRGKQLLDIGTGTGILSIVAAKNGAKKVTPTDIDIRAVVCAQKNLVRNDVDARVLQSDMFENIPQEEYDIIVANLPILPLNQSNHNFASLFDPNYKCHIELFENARYYLPQNPKNGRVILSTADLIPQQFANLEKLAAHYDFSAQVIRSATDLGHVWRTYQFTPK